jgi:hypothetical protein
MEFLPLSEPVLLVLLSLPRDRRPYRLTSRGRRNLQLEVERMRQLTKLAALRFARKEV